MKFQKLWDDALGTYVYTPIVENEFFEDDDDYVEINLNRRRPQNPLVDGWICPYCGKRVYSMEVHPCNQPWCGQTRDDDWFPGGAEWDECNPDNMPKWEDRSGDRG